MIAGATPELILLDADGEEIERIDLSEKTQEECNKLLLEYGFYRKRSKEEVVPKEYQHLPLRRHSSIDL
ncbi:selenoprotein M-like protein [Dinothrombium tinctorium]|uniref:Selenoprotein M-like protein n=1 Tax=Dinothrombium tinctorium TaxID=1965070 RepID=A0A443R204_9ACAR|nr:selenoprotein M-like protein [Dinothrombium tinctorium]